MSADVVIRFVAAVAAVGILAAPALAALARKAQAAWENRSVEARAQEAPGVTAKDLHIVLDLATRLKAAKCMDGVTLCQQLLDVLLGVKTK